MMEKFEFIVYIVILADAIFANIAAWGSYGKEINKRYSIFGKYFPITKGWTTYYLILALWIGWALLRLGILH